nr:phage portal protein [Chloroflexia bacterium]
GESRLVLNYARALIRKTASYVFPGPVSFSALVPTDDPASREAGNVAERLLASLVSELDLARLDLALAIDASVLGDAAIKVTWNQQRGITRVAAVDPGALVARWAPDDPRSLEAVTHVYGLTGTQVRTLFPTLGQAALLADRTYPVAEGWTDARWTLTIAGQLIQDVPNLYGWIPYVIAANNPRPFSFWGQSDLTDLVDVCREINQRMTVLSRILELSGAPIAVLENVSGSDGIAVGPGAKWELPEGARAYLLDLLQGGSSQIHLSYIDQLFRVLHDLSETPRTAFGDSGRDLSGAALEVEIQPLVQKVERMRRMWDGVFTRRNAMLLDLLERFGGHDLKGIRQTSTIWPSILPSDRDGSVRNAVTLVESGIQSRRSAIVGLGSNDPDAELALIRDERDVAGQSPSPS